MLGGGYLLTFISIRLNLAGYSSMDIGWVQSSYCLGMLISSLLAERWIQKLGSAKTYIIFSALLVVTILSQGLYVNPIFWSFLRLVAGFSVGVLYVVIESWLLIQSAPQEKGVVLSIYMVALYAAQTFSQSFEALIDSTSHLPFLVAAIFPFLSIFPIARAKEVPPLLDSVSNKTLQEIFWLSPIGCLGCIMSGVLLSALTSFCPLFAERQGFDVAPFMAFTIGGGFLFQWPIGYLSDHMPRRTLLMMLSAVAIIPCVGIALTLDPTYVLFFSFILGGMAYTIYPVATSYACEAFSQKDITAVMGALLLAYSIGSVAGPLLAAAAMQHYGDFALYHLSTITLLMFLAVTSVAKKQSSYFPDPP
ncbi:MAG: putative permease, major facilitator superfamily [Chlamydiales bacterium]|nr:putative permease, major facilitator superfamily [Chlamydiales bacterium]